MSIVTYENVDTPVFELDTMRYLFRDGLQGMWIDFLPDYAFADTDLTTPANPGEGIAGYVDRSGNGHDGTQSVITARPIFREGPYRAEYDGADDVLPSSLPIPSISEGCFILVGTNGIWIDNEWVNTSGTLSVGPTTYTGGPAGILPVVGDVLSIIVRNEPLTDKERQKVIQAGVKRGSAGLIELGPELSPQPLDFTSGWISTSLASIVDETRFTTSGNGGVFANVGVQAGELYRVVCDFSRLESTGSLGLHNSAGGIQNPIVDSGLQVGTLKAIFAGASFPQIYIRSQGANTIDVGALSLRRLIMPGDTP